LKTSFFDIKSPAIPEEFVCSISMEII